MRPVKTRRILALVFVLPLLAACGGEDEPDAADEPSTAESSESTESPDASVDDGDACSLFSVDEVAEAVGSEVAPGIATDSPVTTGGTQTTCVWNGVESAGSTATLTIFSEAGATDSVKDADSLPLPEVGNDAFIGPFASVWAYAGEGSFTTQWYDFSASDEENLPKSIALAQLYLEKV